MILVCGLPSSGNRLVCSLITRGVEAAGTQETVQLWHGDRRTPSPSAEEDATGRVVVVVPVRSEPKRMASCKRREDIHKASFPTATAQMRRHLFAHIAEHELPTFLLSYEGLVDHPQATVDHLMGWLELPRVQVPSSEPESPGQPEHGRIFDANVKHQV